MEIIKKQELLELPEKQVLRIENINYTVAGWKRYRYAEKAGAVVKYTLKNINDEFCYLIIDEYVRKNIFCKKAEGIDEKRVVEVREGVFLERFGSKMEAVVFNAEVKYFVYEFGNKEVVYIEEKSEKEYYTGKYIADKEIIIGRKNIKGKDSIVRGKKEKIRIYEDFLIKEEVSYDVYLENRIYSFVSIQKLKDNKGNHLGEEYCLEDRDTQEKRWLRITKKSSSFELYNEDEEECIKAFLNFQYNLVEFIEEEIEDREIKKVYIDKYKLDDKSEKIVLLKKGEREYIERDRKKLILVKEFSNEKRYFYGYSVKEKSIGLAIRDEKTSISKYKKDDKREEKEEEEKYLPEKLKEEIETTPAVITDGNGVSSDANFVFSLLTAAAISFIIGFLNVHNII